MNANEFSQINTSISIKERTFLTGEQLNQLLHAKDDDQVYLLLQQMNYPLTVDMLQDTELIEEALMKTLAEEYAFAYEESPSADVVDIFAIKYMYHNLKVLLKSRATQLEFEQLLTPIGRYSLKALQHVVATFEADSTSPLIAEEVKQTWQEYVVYQDPEAITIGMDSAYFRHLREISDFANEEHVTRLINAIIDFFNVIVVKRALEQNKPNSFMYELLSRKGSYTAKEFIDLVRNGELATWFERLNPFIYERDFDAYITKMKNGTITALELETLADTFIHRLLEEGRMETSGVLPLLRYLNGKELEIKNLRLILTGRANRLDTEQITERMRPVYGERTI